jgi:iron complex transport system permease protein
MTKRQIYIFSAGVVGACLILGLAIMCGAAGFGIPDLSSRTGRALLNLRACRIITGFVVGAALSTAGCVLQTVLRNPLAEPYILGVSSGASVGTAIIMATGLAATYPFLLPTGSFIAAMLTVVLIMSIAQRAGGSHMPQNLILTGVVTGSILSSVLMLIITFAGTHTVRSITWWLLGNLQCGSWELLTACTLPIILAVIYLLAHSNTLNALLLGHENAHNLGVNTNTTIPLLIVMATLMTACAVAMSGIIGFAGLIVPHILRRQFGSNHRFLLPGSVIAGGIFLVACDILGRVCIPPHEIPVGVITAVSGGPFFLYLLTRKQR